MKNDSREIIDLEFSKPTEQDRKPVDRAAELTLRYNYRKELREARQPDLYGEGIDIYEEERLRQEHGGW